MSENEKRKPDLLGSDEALNAAIRYACQVKFGVLDSGFLCESVSILAPAVPRCVNDKDSVAKVMRHLKSNRIGCVLVTDAQGLLKGIFSERDCILKAFDSGLDLETTPVSQLMTADPVTQPPDATLAYALNLMSQGGFRHLPIVDEDGMPVGIVSVKDVMDYIVKSFTDDLLAFPTAHEA